SNLHMRHHRAVLLGEARHVEDAGALALEVRRHADDLADRDDARAADAGDEDAVRAFQLRKIGFFHCGIFFVGCGARFALLQPAALDGDEARAEALEAGVVLVARGLVDRALAPVLGLEGLDRQAVRLHAAVAAALAYHLVDHHAPGGVGVLVPLAPAALL